MPVTREETENIAALAHLHLAADELVEMTSDLNKILLFVDRLAELEADDAPASLALEAGPTPLRPDVSQEFPAAEEILTAACASTGRFFSVPRVIEEHEPPGPQ